MRIPFFCLLFFLTLYCMTALAQYSTVSGTIYDSSSGEPLPDVNISKDDSSGSSNENGYYLVRLPPGKHKIIFSYVGFAPDIRELEIKDSSSIRLDIFLKPSPGQLNTVIISAGRFEQKISEVSISTEVIKSSSAENKNIPSAESLLEQVPGVNITNGNASIRGGSGFSYGAGSRVLLLADDLPLLTGDAGDAKWTFLPTESLGQVEIVKGAASAVYGTSALNGVINFRTIFPGDTPSTHISVFNALYDNPSRKVLQWWGNHNPQYQGVSFSHSRKIGGLDLTAGGNLFSDEGYRLGENEQRYRITIGTRYHFKKIKGLTAGVNINEMSTAGGNFLLWQNDSSGAYLPLGGLDSAATTISNYNNRRTSIDPFISYYRGSAQHKLRMRYFNTGNTNNTGQGSLSSLYYTEYQFQKFLKSSGITITAGVSGTFISVSSELYSSHSSQNTGVYAQFDKRWNRLLLSTGIRSEYTRIDEVSGFTAGRYSNPSIRLPFVSRAGINYRLSSSTFARMSFGEGYRSPSIAEKFINTQAGGLKIFPNAGLQPETGWSAEAAVKQGFKIKDWTGYADAACFRTRYYNMIEFAFGNHYPAWIDTSVKYQPPDTLIKYTGFKSINISNAFIDGIEFTAGGEGKAGQVNLSVAGGYTYIIPADPDYNPATDTAGRNLDWWKNYHYEILKYRYRHLVRADVQISCRRFSCGASFRYNSFMENVDHVFEEGSMGSAFQGVKNYRISHHSGDYIFDTRMAYDFNKYIRVSFMVKNLLNREYMGRPADMQPPRSFVIQTNLKF